MADYSSIWRRALAIIVDTLIAFLIIYGLMFFNFFSDVTLSAIYGVVVYALPLVYMTLTEARGQSLGKLILGIKVTNLEGEKPGIWKAFVRNIVRIVDYLPLFYLLAIILYFTTKRKQRVGDLLAGTIVLAK